MRLIATWIADCEKHHGSCKREPAGVLPKRILKITADYICLREDCKGSAKYACVSHCWGPEGPAIKLTSHTVKSLTQSYAISELPKTFQDAVQVCQYLGISYIWIDALCESNGSRAVGG